MDIHARIALLIEEVQVLTAIIEAEGYMTVGSQGQPVAHPAVVQRKAAIMALHRLESRLDPDAGPSALDDFLAPGA